MEAGLLLKGRDGAESLAEAPGETRVADSCSRFWKAGRSLAWWFPPTLHLCSVALIMGWGGGFCESSCTFTQWNFPEAPCAMSSNSS